MSESSFKRSLTSGIVLTYPLSWLLMHGRPTCLTLSAMVLVAGSASCSVLLTAVPAALDVPAPTWSISFVAALAESISLNSTMGKFANLVALPAALEVDFRAGDTSALAASEVDFRACDTSALAASEVAAALVLPETNHLTAQLVP